MSTNENRWGLVIVAVVALFAATVVAIKVLEPNIRLRNAQNERLDRIERQLNRMLELDSRTVGIAKQGMQNGQPVEPSPEMEKRLENLEALSMDSAQRLDENINEQMIDSANQRLDELEERLLLAEEDRQAKEQQKQVMKTRNRKIVSAMNDPILRKKYFDYTKDQANDRHIMIEETFYNDVIDPQWSQETTNQVTTTFTSPALANATLLSADCRTSMCRVVFLVSQFDEDNPQLFENELLAAFSDTLGDSHTNMQRVTDAHGNTEYNLYIFRKGMDIPASVDPLSSMNIDDAVEYLNTNY